MERKWHVSSYHHRPQKPLAMPPATARLPPGSVGHLRPARPLPQAHSSSPRASCELSAIVKPDLLWALYSAHQLVLLTCAPFPLCQPLLTLPPALRTHDCTLTDRQHRKQPSLSLHRHFAWQRHTLHFADTGLALQLFACLLHPVKLWEKIKLNVS